MNTFILKKYIALKSILAPRSVEISTGPASMDWIGSMDWYALLVWIDHALIGVGRGVP